jgi:hypothetical protein
MSHVKAGLTPAFVLARVSVPDDAGVAIVVLFR